MVCHGQTTVLYTIDFIMHKRAGHVAVRNILQRQPVA
jgi:hypothetical protein